MNYQNISVTSDKIIDIFQNAFNKFSNKGVIEKQRWLKFVKYNIRLLNRAIKTNSDNSGILQKLQTNLGHLQYYKTIITRLILETTNHIGMGLKEKRSNRVKWEDINSAFKRRIRTGIILNLKHKDVSEFFNDAYFLFKSRINNILKSIPSVKVNTTFSTEFIIKKVM